MNELNVALAYWSYKDQTEWSAFKAQVSRMDELPTLRRGFGSRMFLSGVALVNKKPCIFYEFNEGEYLLIKRPKFNKITKRYSTPVYGFLAKLFGRKW